MTVGDLLGDLVGRMETHYGGRCCKRNICIATEGHRRFATREGLTILRELADENSVVSLVARPSSVGKQMLAEFWLPKLDAKLAASALARLDLHCFQMILAGCHFARGTRYAGSIDSGVAGFVQVRPFNLWCRMRVGPRIPSCCPSNGKCEPMRKDFKKTEFWRARCCRDCLCIERHDFAGIRMLFCSIVLCAVGTGMPACTVLQKM